MKKYMVSSGLAATLTIGMFGITSAQAQATPGGSTPGSARGFTGSTSIVQLATVSLPEAIQAARTHLGGTALPSEIELSEERGYLVWEVTLGRQAVLVDAGTGEILATRPDDMDEDPARAQTSLLDAVTAAQAAVGLDVFPSSVSLDDERGGLIWELDFGAQEAVVDAATGEVLATYTDDYDD